MSRLEPRKMNPVRFQMLGPIAMYADGRRVPIGPDQLQRLLAGLLADGCKPVPRDRVMMWIWDHIKDDETKQHEALWQLVRKARRLLESVGLHDVLVWSQGCYELRVAPEDVDLHRVTGLLEGSLKAAIEGDEDQEAALLEAALRPIRNAEPLAGLTGRTVDAFRHKLTEQLLKARLRLSQLRISGGRYADQISELTELTAEHPLNEMVTWLNMHAFHRAGRQSDALREYQDLQERMADQGMDVSEALSDLQVRILRRDPALERPDAVAFPGTRGAASPRRLKNIAAGASGAAEEPRPEEPPTGDENDRGGEEAPEEGSNEDTREGEREQPHPTPNATPGSSHFAFYGRVDIPGGVIGTVNNNR
ncbi:AfsR/SARP family transcriptional regulator [Spirillospora sp. NBC_00431]